MSESEFFIEPSDVETQVFDWGVLKWIQTPEITGGDRFSAGVVNLQPGKGHDRHVHPDSDEILYVIRGEGEQEVADEIRHISAGEMVFIPEGIEHATINTGWEPLLLLAVYAPPGPEDVLRDLPGCEIVPPGEFPTEENKQSNDGSGAESGGSE